MATPDRPQGRLPGQPGDNSASNARPPDRSRLEETLVKSPLWKKQTLRDIELTRALAASESSDSDTQTERMVFRLSAQLDERNDEIERLRRAIAKLEDEKSRLDCAHRRELELHRAELKQLQDAYDQFEKESDSLLSELSQKNERLRDECRYRNARSLLES
jgi:predicted RNase H-like nuclease (RuvC/YqgF family)